MSAEESNPKKRHHQMPDFSRVLRHCANCGSWLALEKAVMDGEIWFHVPLYWNGHCQEPTPEPRRST